MGISKLRDRFARRNVECPLLALGLLVALTACATHSSISHPVALTVDQLVRDPHTYDQKVVRVQAWITLHNENYNLWGSTGAMDSYDTRACVSLQNYSKYTVGAISALDGAYVEVTGVFTSDATAGREVVRLNACSNLALALDEKAVIRVVKPPTGHIRP